MCSIAQDHSVALLNLRDHRCLLLASCHRFPVQTVRWKPAEDFLIIGLSDGSVYVWQIETGKFSLEQFLLPFFRQFHPSGADLASSARRGAGFPLGGGGGVYEGALLPTLLCSLQR